MALQYLPLVGEAIGGLCNLGSSLVDGIIGPQGLFAQTLNALSGTNRFQDPGAAPGEYAEMLEQKLMQLEQMIAERRGMLTQQTQLLGLNDKVGRVASVLSRTSLSDDQREAVLAELTKYLSNRNVAEQLGTALPEDGAFVERLDEMLSQYGILEQDRVPIVQTISDILNNVEERTAA